MARDFNQNRIANARLVGANIDKFGKTFAIQSPWNADGFSSVNVTVEQVPSDIKQYLEGDNSITVYPVPSNVDKLCEYALASFPNIEDLYLFKTSAIVVLEDNLSYLLGLNKIYVPTDLLSAYQSAYPTLSSKFDIIVEDYTLTIPFVGDTTLTSEYVDSVIAMLSSAEKNAITKVVIPTDFTQESANDIAWGYDFSAIVNLDNNIWYGATQFDFTEYTIIGSGELTATIANNKLSQISVDKITLIEKIVVPIDFTSYASGSITEIQAFMNTNSIDKLVTTYSGGAMELSLSGDIVAKINDIGKTLDEALVYARTYNGSTLTKDLNAIIVPPHNNIDGYNFCSLSTNIVYIDDVSVFLFNYNFATSVANIVRIKKMKIVSFSGNVNMFAGVWTQTSIKEINMDFSLLQENEQKNIVIFGDNRLLEKMTMTNFMGDLTLQVSSHYDSFTRQALVDLINSLGTPSTTKTLTIGATNLAKLTADDIAIATQKNWLVQ